MRAPHRGRLLALAALSGMALPALTGCTSSAAPEAPRTVVTLPADPAGNTTTTVTLTVGQSFAVRHAVGAQEKQWAQRAAGDGRVVGHSGTATASACPSAVAGCATLTDDVYTARAAGRTAVVWSYASVVSCTRADAALCAPITRTIEVVVR